VEGIYLQFVGVLGIKKASIAAEYLI
jgi:hypothetical protein